MDLEYHTLMYHGALDLLPHLTNSNIMSHKWIFILNYSPRGMSADGTNQCSR